MIICGFPGTGKSMMAKLSNWVDLESTPFEKDWWRYAKVAKHMSDNGYIVMVSTHKELLECFEQMEVSYTVIVPSVSDKDNYLHRYKSRGNTEDFIKTVRDNWIHWIFDILAYQSVLRTVVILPKDGCIRAWADEYKDRGRC